VKLQRQVSLDPEPQCGPKRVDSHFAPPVGYLAGAMQFAMVATAQRHGEFVADFEAES